MLSYIKITFVKEEIKMNKALLSLAFAGTILLTSCGSGMKNSDMADTKTAMPGVNNSAEYAKSDEAYSESNDEGSGEASSLSYKQSEVKSIDRQMLIYSCNMSVDVLEFDKAVDDIHELIKKYNGFIENENYSDGGNSSKWQYSDDEKWKQLNATIRVPSAVYEDFCKDAEAIGDLRSKNSSVENLVESVSVAVEAYTFFTQCRGYILLGTSENNIFFAEFVLSSREPYSAVMEYGNIIGDTLHIRCDMCGEKYAPVFVLDVLGKNIKKLVTCNGVKTACRLVKYHKVSLVRQCNGYHKLHFHALGKFADTLVVRKSEGLETTCELLAVPVLVEGLQLFFYLFCGEMVSKVKAVKDYTQLFLYGDSVCNAVKAENAYLAAVYVSHVEYGTDSSGLARAVFTYKSHNITLWQRKADILQCKAVVSLIKSFYLQNVLHKSFLHEFF